MTDLRGSLERARSTFPPPDLPLERVLRRHDRRQRNRRLGAGLVAGVIAFAGIALFVRTIALEPDVIPAGPVGNGSIVVRDGGHLIAIGPDGQDPLPLVDVPFVAEGCPIDARCTADAPYAWSADGTLLAFVAGPNPRPSSIYAIPADGGDPRLIASCDGPCTDMAWSPRGHRLAFAAGNTITVVDVDAGERTEVRLAPCADYCVISPPSPVDLAWSLDGSRIASVSDYDTITVSAADGSSATMLVEPRPNDPEPEDLTWSSDTTIVFSTQRMSSEETEGIWSLDVTTAATMNLVDVGLRPSIINGNLVAPDGSLVWAQGTGRCPNPGCPFTGSIWTADGDGSNARILYDAGCCTAANTIDVFAGPVLSPDGTHLAFSVIYGRDRAHESGVYVMNLDGADVRRISAIGEGPAWQPVPKAGS